MGVVPLTLRSTPRITAAKFRAILAKGTSAGSSPVTPIAFECYDIIAAAGLDPAILLAIFAKESQYGVTGIAPQTKNWGNVRTPQVAARSPATLNGFAVYPNWRIGLVDLCDRLNLKYIPRGLDTVETAIPVYAPASENDTDGYIAFVVDHVLSWQAEEVAPMAFDWDPKQWSTVDAFTAYLATLPPPAWLKGITFHNTAAPTRAQWQGMTHVRNLGIYYRDQVQNPDGSRGWPSGPNLFLAAATSFDGIFQGTPVNHPGTHAGPCNSDHLGIEIVGNYNLEPWPAPVNELVYGVLMAVCRWANVPVAKVVGHRECMPGHTDCPGTKIDPGAVRAELGRRIANVSTIDYKGTWGVKHPEIAYNPTFGFPSKWRAELDAGRSLGAVLSPEMGDAIVWQVFEFGVLKLVKATNQITVLR
jgi:hypothetical protein